MRLQPKQGGGKVYEGNEGNGGKQRQFILGHVSTSILHVKSELRIYDRRFVREREEDYSRECNTGALRESIEKGERILAFNSSRTRWGIKSLYWLPRARPHCTAKPQYTGIGSRQVLGCAQFCEGVPFGLG